MKFPESIFFLKNHKTCQYQKTDTTANHRWIHKSDQIQPYHHNRNTSCHRCLNQIKQIFLPLQVLYLCDYCHRTKHAQCSNWQYKVQRPSHPAGITIPQYGQYGYQKQLPHFIFQNIPPLTVGNGHQKPGAGDPCRCEPEPV